MHLTEGGIVHFCVDKMNVITMLLCRDWQLCRTSQACLVCWRVKGWHSAVVFGLGHMY